MALNCFQDYNKMPFSVLIATFAKSYATYVGPILAGTVIKSIANDDSIPDM